MRTAGEAWGCETGGLQASAVRHLTVEKNPKVDDLRKTLFDQEATRI